MPYYGSLTILDRYGWTKSVSLEKALLMVGSAASNDIILSEDHGGGVAPVHLQILHAQAELGQVRVINLTSTPFPMLKSGTAGGTVVPANTFTDLDDGDAIRLGDFSLTFLLQAQRGISRSQRSEHLGLKLELPSLELRAGKQLAGQLTVSHYGNQKRCQFEIDLEGLPPDCYQIDPAPLLYPNSEEQLRIRFFHRGTHPPAGDCPFTLRITTSSAYPTEEVILREILKVAPVYQIEVCMLDSLAPVKPREAAFRQEPLKAPSPAVLPIPSPALVESPEPEPEPLEPLPVKAQTAAPTLESPPPAVAVFEPASQPAVEWWSNSQTDAPHPAEAEPFSRPRQARKTRLPLSGQNIQVIRTSQEPEAEPPPSNPSPDTEITQ